MRGMVILYHALVWNFPSNPTSPIPIGGPSETAGLVSVEDPRGVQCGGGIVDLLTEE